MTEQTFPASFPLSKVSPQFPVSHRTPFAYAMPSPQAFGDVTKHAPYGKRQ